MVKKSTLIFCLFIGLISQLLGQTTIPESLQGSWYVQDGTNTLGIHFGETFVLYEADFWEIESIQGNTLEVQNVSGKKVFNYKIQKDVLAFNSGEISLTFNRNKTTNLKNRKTGSTDVSRDFFMKDQVVLQGVIIPKDTMPFTASVIYNYAFAEGQQKYVSEVDAQGRFKIIFPLDHPQVIMFRAGDAFTTFFSTPGQKQALIVEEGSFKGGFDSWYQVKEMDFMGALAAENEEYRLLNPEFMKVRNYFKNDSLQKALDADNYLDYRLDLMEDHQAFYSDYFDSIPVSNFVQDYSIRDARTYAADDLKRYVWMHNLGKNGGRIESVDVSNEYLNQIISMMPDELEDLMTDSYSNLIREFSTPMMPRERKEMHFYTLDLMENHFNNQLLPEEEKVSVAKWLQRERAKESFTLYANFQDFPELGEKYNDKLKEIRAQVFWDRVVQISNTFSEVQSSSLIAVFLDMNYTSRGVSIPDYIIEKLDQVKILPQVRATINQQIKDLEILRNKKFVEGVEISAASNNLLNQIKEKHKGKVIYIDVWATWCGPCIGEFSNLSALKKSKLDDVVFVYICAQSPKKAFDTMVKKYELTGDNYYLDNYQYQLFDKEANISGFPTYMVITKEGKLVRNGIKRPSAGQDLVNQLLEFSTRE